MEMDQGRSESVQGGAERELLWSPPDERVQASAMYRFMARIGDRYGADLGGYRDLHRWSVDHVAEFWAELWDFCGVVASQPFTSVVDDPHRLPGARWFADARLNYAQNMLRHAGDAVAIVFRGEDHTRCQLTGHQLRASVERFATGLRARGIRPGDRVVGYLPNLPETIIAMLGAAAVGAVWSSCATDVGPAAAIDRLGQVEPRVVVTADAYTYKGKPFDVLAHAAQVVGAIASVEHTVIVHYAGDPAATWGAGGPAEHLRGAVAWDDFLAAEAPTDFIYEQLPSDHPMLVMFSSGTTGKPKCMVQSGTGVLLNQLKEHVLHHDLGPGQRLLYITTCSWMMWNWQLAALGSGASLVLYDGNPAYPGTEAIWKVVEEERVTAFGLSASYVHSLMAQSFSPRRAVDLSALRLISQTGSTLNYEAFGWLYREVKEDFWFNSIAGGTDMNGCFATGNPLAPVYAGELQGPALAMDVAAFDQGGGELWDAQGELVCRQASPSMPLRFWNDPNGSRYRDAYFDLFPGVWRHGDYVQFHSDTGGITFFGRSDSVLKPSGVRIGTAEIYNQVDRLPEVLDSLAIGQDHRGDQRVLLFVKLADGVTLTEELERSIRRVLRVNASPRHVPARILAVDEIPTTLSGKKVESAVTNIVNGRAVTNRDALSNPASLTEYEALLAKLQD